MPKGWNSPIIAFIYKYCFVRAKDVLCFICFQTHFIGCEKMKENVIEPKYKDKYRDVRRRNTLKKALILQNIFLITINCIVLFLDILLFFGNAL